jgi:RHS repeat-associated protein
MHNCPKRVPNHGCFHFSYDPMGRIAQFWQSQQHVTTPPSNIVLSYDYDLIGDELDYSIGNSPPGSTKYVSTYNGAGRLTSFTTSTWVDATNPANLLTAVQYDPFGHLISGNLANGLSLSSAYDARGRVSAMAVGTSCANGNCSTNKYRFTTSYAPNSDILSSTDTVNGNWTYTYDSLNRLSTGVANKGQGCSWDYDRYGNRWHQNTHSGSCTASQYSFSGNNNRIDGSSYDADGNLLNDGFHSYQYDAENRIVFVDGGATKYVYDAEGRRYSKTAGGVTVATIYDREGHPRIRTNFGPGELFVAGMHLGTYIVNSGHTDSIFYYDHSDWLGTERVRTDLTGNPCETIASLPFGDNQKIAGTCGDVSPLHFTGKERDTESNLDYFGARHYASSMGRFMQADEPFAGQEPAGPQSWNLYSYVRNSPSVSVDPDGLDCIYINNDTGALTGFSRGDCDNSNAASANSGYYVNGTVDTINENTFGQVTGYSGTGDQPGTLISGNLSPTNPDVPLNFFAQGVVSQPVLGYARGTANNYIAPPLLGFLSFAVPGALSAAAPEITTLGIAGGPETVVIGKLVDLESGVRPGERTIDLPDQGGSKGNWAQNSSRLREAMNEGNPIRDASAGNPGSNTGFLRAERNLLPNNGWTLKGDTWYPPGT